MTTLYCSMTVNRRQLAQRRTTAETGYHVTYTAAPRNINIENEL